MERKPDKVAGMKGFTVVWIGQVVSLLGTAMSNFALTIWAYEITGKATALALVGFFFLTPMVVLSPIAGAIVDRSNRKLMMMLSDLAAGVTTVLILVLYASGNLQIWHLYIAALISGSFQTFQWPAFSAAITMMLPKEQYARANGMMDLAGSASGIFAPVLAGALLAFIGLTGILIIDIVSFVVAILALLLVYIPQPEITEEGRAGQGSIWKESAYGFRYIFDRPSLLGLQLVFLFLNLTLTIAIAVFAPMILARTNSNEVIFGSVQSAGAIGGVVGGAAMGAWGGPKRRVHGVLTGMFFSGLLGIALMGVGQGLLIWIVASFFMQFFIPIINGSNQAIWQAKVAPDVQGRVFATRRLIAWLVTPLSRLAAGPLADYVFEPAMMPSGGLANLFGWLVGTGPGAGMGLMFVLMGIAGALVGLGGYAFKVIRDAEDILPDHQATAAAG